MKKPHAMMWYPEAWKSSPKVTAMPAAARAGYFDLLCAVWLNGASLPNDDAMLRACSRLTPSEWKRHRMSILAMFTVEDGEIKNERLTREYDKTIEKIEKRKAAADARWGNKQKQSTSNANALQMESNADASRTRSRTRDTDKKKELPTGVPKKPTTTKDLVPIRHAFGEFGKVQLSEAEHESLVEKLGHELTATYIEAVDGWVAERPNEAKRKNRDFKATILNWHRRDVAEGRNRIPQQGGNLNGKPTAEQIRDRDRETITREAEAFLRKRGIDMPGA